MTMTSHTNGSQWNAAFQLTVTSHTNGSQWNAAFHFTLLPVPRTKCPPRVQLNESRNEKCACLFLCDLVNAEWQRRHSWSHRSGKPEKKDVTANHVPCWDRQRVYTRALVGRWNSINTGVDTDLSRKYIFKKDVKANLVPCWERQRVYTRALVGRWNSINTGVDTGLSRKYKKRKMLRLILCHVENASVCISVHQLVGEIVSY